MGALGEGERRKEGRQAASQGRCAGGGGLKEERKGEYREGRKRRRQ
jgi:hypothetical protein